MKYERNNGSLKWSAFLINFIVHFKISELILKENSSTPLSSTFKRFSSEIFFKEWFKAQYTTQYIPQYHLGVLVYM